MRRFQLASVMFGMLFSATVSAQHQAPSEIPWFDMKQCAFCKNMASVEDRLDEVACDTHKIENGMIMVSFIPDDLKADMQKAHEQMAQTVKELESGKTLPMCGFCQNIGMFLGQGAKMQKLVGEHGEVTLFTSDNPDIVKKLHEFADRTIAETKAQLEKRAKAG